MNHTRADALIEYWHTAPYPAFQRLILYGARKGSVGQAKALLDAMSKDPRSWLWADHNEVELATCLLWLLNTLETEERSALIELILRGPPRATFREDLEGPALRDVSDRLAWRLLRSLQAVGADAAELVARLSSIEREHPEWVETIGRGRAMGGWGEEEPGEPAKLPIDNLAALDDKGILSAIREHGDSPRTVARLWDELLANEPARGLRILGMLLPEGGSDTEVWSAAVGGLHHAVAVRELHREVIAVIERIPSIVLERPHQARLVADAIGAMSKDVEPGLRESLLSAWDKVVLGALRETLPASSDRLTEALNSMAGVLTESLLSILAAASPKRDEGLPGDLRDRMELLVGAKSAAAASARVMLSSRLSLLHGVDPVWSESTLVPLLDWNNPSEAAGAWQGFLWSPWLRPSLWLAIKGSFIQTFDHLPSFDRYRDSLAQLLASVAIEGVDTLTPIETAECLRKLEDSGRAQVAFWIQRRLEGAGEQAGILWADRIAPWLECSWPTEPRLVGPETSQRFAWVAMKAGDAFPVVVSTTERLLTPIEYPDGVIQMLEKHGMVTKAPRAAMSLVYRLVGNEPGTRVYTLDGFLKNVSAAQGDLVATPEFRRLGEASKGS